MASIRPLTDGTLKLTIAKDDGTPLTDATLAVGQVFTPRGKHVGVDMAFTYHTGSKTWDMPVRAEWSDDGKGRALQGEYLVQLVFQSAGKRLTDNIRYNVTFTDDS